MPIAVGTGQHIVDVRIKALSEQRLSQHIGRERQRISIGAGFKKAEKALSIRVGGNGIHGDDVVILSFVDFIMPVDTRRRLNEGVGNEPLHIAFGPIQKGNKEENQEREGEGFENSAFSTSERLVSDSDLRGLIWAPF